MDIPRPRIGCEQGEEMCDICQRTQPEFEDSGIGSSQMQVFSEGPFSSDMILSSPPVLREVGQQSQSAVDYGFEERHWVRSRVMKKRRQEGSEVKELIECLEEWVGKYPLCHLNGGPNP